MAKKTEIPANLAESGISNGRHRVKSMLRTFCTELDAFRLPVDSIPPDTLYLQGRHRRLDLLVTLKTKIE
jgi:hypothetical protein